MKNLSVLVLGGPKEIDLLKEKFKTTNNITISRNKISSLKILIANNNIQILCDNIDIKAYDFVWVSTSWKYRQIAYIVYLYLSKHNVPCNKIEIEKTKLVDTFILALEGASIPKTIYCTLDEIYKNIDIIKRFCGFPFLIKVTRGLKGKGIFYIKNQTDLKDKLKSLKKSDIYMIQEFIPNDFDYRVIISNNKPSAASKRIRKKGEFRNNAALGSEEIFLELDSISSDILSVANNATNIVGLDWSGVDLVICNKTEKIYILEVNRNPGITKGSVEVGSLQRHLLSKLKISNLL